MPPRYRRAGWVFPEIGGIIVGVGATLFLLSLEPGWFEIPRALGFPYGGGFLGAFLILWGALLLVRVSWRAGPSRVYGPVDFQGRRFDPTVLAARRRYARGEISREQLREIIAELRGPPGPPRC